MAGCAALLIFTPLVHGFVKATATRFQDDACGADFAFTGFDA